MFEREATEKLLIDLGHAINANNGQCYIIESALCRATTLCVEVLAHFDEEDRRSQVGCAYEGCVAQSEILACGRELYRDPDEGKGHPKPARYCRVHANMVTDERSPEYVDTCPNCGCMFGVN